MASTTSTTYASTIQTKWQKKLLKVAEGYLYADRFANTQVMGKGEGNTVRINKILRPAKQTTASTAGTLIAAASAKALYSNYIDLTMEIWGDSFAVNEDVDIQSFVTDKQNMDVIANQMARSLNYQITKKMSTQCYRHRIDNDTTYIKTGTASAAGASATTTLRDAGVLTQADDAWIGGYITFTSPETENYDVTRLVSDSDQSDAEVTFAAVNHDVAATTKYSITVGTELGTSDKLTTAGILYCSALHEKMETEKFDGGMFRMFIGPEQHQDLWSDTTFLNSAIYDKSERFEKYKAGTWFDTEFLVISDQYREDTDGTENAAAGAVYVSPMFGKNSYTVIRYGNPGGSGKFATKFMIVDTPDSGNLRNSAKYMSWKGTYAAGVTRATSIIGLMTGATSLNVTV